MRPLRALLSAAVLSVVTVLPLQGQMPPSATELMRQIQAHYDTIKDFKADFTQTYQAEIVLSKGTKGARTASGDVRIKKPGRMWWRYKAPEKREFIADGTRYYEWDPADNSVAMESMSKLDETSAPLLFLTGRGNLARDFTATLPASQPDGQWQVHLTPKSPQAAFTDVTLRVNRRSYMIEGLVTKDPQGGTIDMRFANLRENNGFTDKDFEFKIPRDAVIK